MAIVNQYYLQSELAQAAYGTYSFGAIDPNLLTRNNVGMSPTQAAAFASTYTVVDQYNDLTTGLSATVFESVSTGERHLAVRGTNDPLDIWTDFIDIALLGTPERQAQYASLRDQVGAWLGDGTLTSGFTVTGHSLGGFLAGALLVDYPAEVSHAYLYNAPGVGGLSAGMRMLAGLQSEPSLDLTRVSNLIALAGPSLSAGLGLDWGAPIPVFIEGQFPNILNNHSIGHLTDALGVYALLGRLNPALTLSDLTPILEAGSNQPANSLDDIVNALGELLGAGATVAIGDRDQFYMRIQAIEAVLPIEPGFGMASLVGLLEPDAAQSDKGFLNSRIPRAA